MIHRAKCLLACGDVPGEETDLKASGEFLEQVNPSVPGPVVARAKWWEVRAKLDLKAENLNEAADALVKTIRNRQQMIGIQGATSPYAAAESPRRFSHLTESLEASGQRRGCSGRRVAGKAAPRASASARFEGQAGPAWRLQARDESQQNPSVCPLLHSPANGISLPTTSNNPS